MKHKKVLFAKLLTQGKLYQHCAEIEKQARDMFDTLVEQIKEAEGITEQLKAQDQMAWVGAMNGIRNAAEEIVNAEVIFA